MIENGSKLMIVHTNGFVQIIDLVKWRTCFKHKADVHGKVRDVVYLRVGNVVCLALQQIKPFQLTMVMLETEAPVIEHEHDFESGS